jgi:hypothetical protein
MDTTKHPKAWFIIALLVLLAVVMLVIIKHYNADMKLQQKIYDQSGITNII